MRRQHRGLLHPSFVSVLALALLALAVLPSATAEASATSTISGSIFKDLNRDGLMQSDEPALGGQLVYLLDSAGNRVATGGSDATGRYSFSGVPAGDYVIEYDTGQWWELREQWVPTTTNSLFPRVGLRVDSSPVTVDFGWRQILRSLDLNAPLSAYDGPNGIRTESFNDAVTARQVYDTLVQGLLVGAEAPSATIRLDYGTTSRTESSVNGVPGGYNGYRGTVYVSWLAWLDGGHATLFHEYGHVWSLYHAYITQQDDTLTAYLQARGLLGDTRLDSSSAWSRRELVAEDYRQLFGTSAAQARLQENTAIPKAADVPGLKEFLRDTFTKPPSTAPPPPPPPPASEPLTLSNPAVSPTPVAKSASVSTVVSTAASVTVTIENASGALVRTLLADAATGAGSLSVRWDRKDSTGRRVRAGTYVAVARASTATAAVSASSTFPVS